MHRGFDTVMSVPQGVYSRVDCWTMLCFSLYFCKGLDAVSMVASPLCPSHQEGSGVLSILPSIVLLPNTVQAVSISTNKSSVGLMSGRCLSSQSSRAQFQGSLRQAFSCSSLPHIHSYNPTIRLNRVNSLKTRIQSKSNFLHMSFRTKIYSRVRTGKKIRKQAN